MLPNSAGAGVSAAPVVDDKGVIVGIVSEADLIRRAEIGTAPRKSWLSRLLDSEAASATTSWRPMREGHRCDDQGGRDGGRGQATLSRTGRAHREAWHQARFRSCATAKLSGIVSRADLLRSAAVAGAGGAGSHQPTDKELRETVVGGAWQASCLDVEVADQRLRQRWRRPSLGLRAKARKCATPIASPPRTSPASSASRTICGAMPASVGMGV